MSAREEFSPETQSVFNQLEAAGFSGTLYRDGHQFEVGPPKVEAEYYYRSPFVSLIGPVNGLDTPQYVVTEEDFYAFGRASITDYTSPRGLSIRIGSAWSMWHDAGIIKFANQEGIHWQARLEHGGRFSQISGVTADAVLQLFGPEKKGVRYLDAQRYHGRPKSRELWLRLGEHLAQCRERAT